MPNARRSRTLWCAIHVNDSNPGLIICEFELEEDDTYPLVPSSEMTPKLPEEEVEAVAVEREAKKEGVQRAF
ncbi:sensor histidine kinase response [Paraphaeosphaeria minitans]|uniref:Sensor histidine kinase response n=1 Tax=Paraphaeosphaeria minitans TaxID=565426 RepID=A0A9P6G712_9PLEO|nr:sensor histidine kinase response [Paraphaeosphaeria minitans]